jgi:hypothetical protein
MGLRSLVFGSIPHPHLWIELTSENAYGNSWSRHWGRYGGRREEECALCCLVREKRDGGTHG